MMLISTARRMTLAFSNQLRLCRDMIILCVQVSLAAHAWHADKLTPDLELGYTLVSESWDV